MKRLVSLRLVLFLALFTLLLSSTACRTVRRDEPIVGPLPLDNPAVEHGRIVFANHCHACHPGGAGGLGPAINDKPFPRFLMKTQVRAGLGAMPSFDQHAIPSNDLDDLMKYVLTLRHHDGAATDH
jgi:mono/diheme cytochrome c family protein